MSTKCLIILKNDIEQFKYAYCHYDGYPEHMLPILMTYYSDASKINDLISKGDLLFCDRPDDVEYFGDGQHGDEQLLKNLDEINDFKFIDYFYLFKDNSWFFKKNDKSEWRQAEMNQ